MIGQTDQMIPLLIQLKNKLKNNLKKNRRFTFLGIRKPFLIFGANGKQTAKNEKSKTTLLAVNSPRFTNYTTKQMETNNTQSKQFNKLSRTSGKEFSLEQRRQIQSLQTENSLNAISAPGLFKYTPEEAWHEGTNIKTALRCYPEKTRTEIIDLIQKTIDFIDAKKTLQGFEDVALCAEMIFEVFPVLKLEEFRLVCDRMKQGHYGKFYERLKIQEFRECLIKHEEERAPILERQHQQVLRGTDDPTNVPEYDAEAAKLAWRLKNNPFLIPGKNDND